MESSWFFLILSAAVIVSTVLLTVICVDCWNKRPLVSISQTHASDEYMRSTEFSVIHPATDLSSIRSAPHLLSPPRALLSSADPGTQRRHRPFTPTDTESNPSYENPAEGPEYVNPDPNLPDSDIEDHGYIIVIPDGDALGPSSPSRASTPSSDVRHEYVNLEEEDRDYLNVAPELSQKAAHESSGQSDSDDDYEGNYVNQPSMIHI